MGWECSTYVRRIEGSFMYDANDPNFFRCVLFLRTPLVARQAGLLKHNNWPKIKNRLKSQKDLPCLKRLNIFCRRY